MSKIEKAMAKVILHPFTILLFYGLGAVCWISIIGIELCLMAVVIGLFAYTGHLDWTYNIMDGDEKN